MQLRDVALLCALLAWHLSEETKGTDLYKRWVIALTCPQPSSKEQSGKGAGEGIHSPQGTPVPRDRDETRTCFLRCSLYPESEREDVRARL